MQVPGTNLIFWFRHGRMHHPNPDRRIEVPFTEAVIATIMRVEVPEGEAAQKPIVTVVARGLAYCAPADRYDRETGRKLALTRALFRDRFPKDVRRSIWNTYHARREPRTRVELRESFRVLAKAALLEAAAGRP